MLPLLRPLALGLLGALALLAPAEAQPLPFGSADDPLELDLTPVQTRPRGRVGLYAGPAFVGSRWRTALMGEAEAQSGRLSVGLAETLHPGAGGLYEGELSEPYDALRVLRYARLNATPTSRVYARVGPLNAVDLGVGHLARRYRTTTAWDERTIGAEAAAEAGPVRVKAFTGDVRMNAPVGGEIEVSTGRILGPLREVRLGLAAVRDLGLALDGDPDPLTGGAVTLRGTLAQEDVAALTPWASYAHYVGRGHGVGVGVDAGSEDFSGVARAYLRLGLFASTARFVPGHVGPFYQVNAGRERVVQADPYYAQAPRAARAGTPLDSVRAGLDVVAEVRLVRYGGAEVYQHVRRHLGPDRLSAYGLRVAAETPAGLRFELGLERQGFRGLLGLFGSLGDENALVLDVGAPVARVGYVFVRSRYSYRRLGAEDPLAPGAFLVERRFEPLAGLRLSY